MGFLVFWLVSGIISSIIAIYIFRRHSENIPVNELYLAAVAPLFGTGILLLVFIDLARNSKGDTEKRIE